VATSAPIGQPANITGGTRNKPVKIPRTSRTISREEVKGVAESILKGQTQDFKNERSRMNP